MANKEKKGIWVTNGLLSQFSSSWAMLKLAIENCPDEYWYGTDKDWNFSRTVYHIIETQEFYMRNSPEGMVWGKLLGDIDNKDLSVETVYPSKGILIGSLEEINKQITK